MSPVETARFICYTEDTCPTWEQLCELMLDPIASDYLRGFTHRFDVGLFLKLYGKEATSLRTTSAGKFSIGIGTFTRENADTGHDAYFTIDGVDYHTSNSGMILQTPEKICRGIYMDTLVLKMILECTMLVDVSTSMLYEFHRKYVNKLTENNVCYTLYATVMKQPHIKAYLYLRNKYWGKQLNIYRQNSVNVHETPDDFIYITEGNEYIIHHRVGDVELDTPIYKPQYNMYAYNRAWLTVPNLNDLYIVVRDLYIKEPQ